MKCMDRLELALNRCFRERVSKAGLHWPDLATEADEIVVFGSRASRIHAKGSDLDVLVVGKATRRLKRCGLDLICIPAAGVDSQSWLDSELAGHISKYGVWLKGVGDWRDHVLDGRAAAERKEKRIVSLVHSVKRAWSNLHASFHHRYQLTIRRELQRLLLLRTVIPVPPTPALDAHWQAGIPGRQALLALSNSFLDDPEEFIGKAILIDSLPMQTSSMSTLRPFVDEALPNRRPVDIWR